MSGDPYRLYALDKFPADPYNPQPLYSSIPYLTAHSKNSDSSIAFITASEAWVDLSDHP